MPNGEGRAWVDGFTARAAAHLLCGTGDATELTCAPRVPTLCQCSFILQSMEDDFAGIVGLTVEFWLVIIVFFVISGPFGARGGRGMDVPTFPVHQVPGAACAHMRQAAGLA